MPIRRHASSSSNLCDTLIEHLHGRAVSSAHNKYELVGATMLCHRPVPPLQPAFRLASRSSDQTCLSKRRQPVNGDSLRAILRNFAQCASTSACHLLVADSSLAASVQSQTRERRPSFAATLPMVSNTLSTRLTFVKQSNRCPFPSSLAGNAASEPGPLEPQI